MTNHTPIDDASAPLHDRDLLISRVIDGRASSAEWTTLETLAARDPAVWRELATAQRDQRAIETIVASAGDLSQSVDLPLVTAEPERHTAGRSRLRIWGGWVAAAVLAFAAAGQFNSITNLKKQLIGNTAGSPLPVSFTSADEAFDQYRNKGKAEGIVLGEIPDRVLLSAEPAADGRGYTVTIVRQVIERRHVNDMLQFNSRNELGQTMPVASPWPAPRRPATGL
jgi:hypothetical protein